MSEPHPPDTGPAQTPIAADPADAAVHPALGLPTRLRKAATLLLLSIALFALLYQLIHSGETVTNELLTLDVQDAAEAEQEALRGGAPNPGDALPARADDTGPAPRDEGDSFSFMDRIQHNPPAQPVQSAPAPGADEQERLAALATRKAAPSVMVRYQPGSASQSGSAAIETPPSTEPGATPQAVTPPFGRARHGAGDSLAIPDTAPPALRLASYRPDQDYLVLQGTVINLTLETRINSNLPGPVRALVNQPVYAANGSRLLIPARSRLYGSYPTARQAEQRLFLVWQRLITPEGIEVFLDSPGAGPIGAAGLGGRVNKRFIERFGAAMIFSVVGSMNRSNNDNGISLYYHSAARNAAEIALENSVNLAPIIEIKPGAAIAAVVNRDLDFRAALTAFNAQRASADPGTAVVPITQTFADDIPSPGGDTDPAAHPPVYLVPERLVTNPAGTAPAPGTATPSDTAPAPPAPACARIVLQRDRYLSYQLERWLRDCLDKPMDWRIGGMRTWRDYPVERAGIIPLPQGLESLSDYLAEHYRIQTLDDPDRIIFTEGEHHGP